MAHITKGPIPPTTDFNWNGALQPPEEHDDKAETSVSHSQDSASTGAFPADVSSSLNGNEKARSLDESTASSDQLHDDPLTTHDFTDQVATDYEVNGHDAPKQAESPNAQVTDLAGLQVGHVSGNSAFGGNEHSAESEFKPMQSHAVADERSLSLSVDHKEEELDRGEGNSTMNGPVTESKQEADRIDTWGSLTMAAKPSYSEDDGFFDQQNAQTKPIYSPPDPDARFEEGLPLLDEATDSVMSPVQQPMTAETRIGSMFDNDEDSEDGFFTSIKQSSPQHGGVPEPPPQVTRKSTSHVVGELAMGPDSPMSDASFFAEAAHDAASNEKSGNMANEGPSEEDLAARWEAALDDDDADIPQMSESEAAEAPREEELAARWEAELDDDDVLLPDEALVVADETPQDGVSQELVDGVNRSFNPPPSRPLVSSYAPHQPSTSDLVQDFPLSASTNQQHPCHASTSLCFHPSPSSEVFSIECPSAAHGSGAAKKFLPGAPS